MVLINRNKVCGHTCWLCCTLNTLLESTKVGFYFVIVYLSLPAKVQMRLITGMHSDFVEPERRFSVMMFHKGIIILLTLAVTD